jgi:hypothetical protein
MDSSTIVSELLTSVGCVDPKHLYEDISASGALHKMNVAMVARALMVLSEALDADNTWISIEKWMVAAEDMLGTLESLGYEKSRALCKTLVVYLVENQCIIVDEDELAVFNENEGSE